MGRVDRIKEWLREQSEYDIIQIWNQYQRECYYEEEIWDMSELPLYIEGWEPMKVIETFVGVGFDDGDRYFYFNGQGWPVSFNYIDEGESPICYSDLARYIDREDDDCGYAELQDILYPEVEEEMED